MNSVCLLHFQRRKQDRSTLPPSDPPTVFSFGSNGNIEYIYSATGTKLSKVVTNGSTVTTTDYDGNYIYTNNALSQILQPQGYIVPDNGTYMYYFQYKDNLGSNRLTYFDNNGDGTISSSEIAEQDNYYPFGMLQTGYNNVHNGTGSNFKYNGKELQDDAVGSYHLNLYDYGARFYDPALGRWTTPDPLAQYDSPYIYAGNNPVLLNDPSGMLAGDYYNKEGHWLGSDHIDDNKVYIASSVTKNDKGVVTSAKNSQELSITHSEFQTISAIVKNEAGNSSNTKENLWIAHAANNAAQESGKSLYSMLMSGYSAVPRSKKVPLSVSNNSSAAKAARAGVINVLTGGKDPTGGATLWDGTDFIAWGLNSPYGTPQQKFTQYKSISITGSIYRSYLNSTLSYYSSGKVRYHNKYYTLPAPVFKNRNNWVDGNFLYTTGENVPFRLISTGTAGRSIFWKAEK